MFVFVLKALSTESYRHRYTAKNTNVANNLESIETALLFFSRRSEHFRNDEVKMHLNRCPAFKWKTQLINCLGNAEIV